MQRSSRVVHFLGAVLLFAPGLLAQVTAEDSQGPVPVNQALWDALARPAFDADKVAVVEHAKLGQSFDPIGGGERRFHAAFRGSGRLRLAPRLPIEMQQLMLHGREPSLDAEFEEAVFLFTDETADELAAQVRFQSGDASGLQKLCQGRIDRWTKYGLNMEGRLLKALLADDSSLHALFVAALKTADHGWLTLLVDATDPEEVELRQFDSARRGFTIWTKFPAEGRTPQDVFADPTARHEYLVEGYKLDVTVEQGLAEVELLVRRPGERVLLMALDPSVRVSEVKTEAGEALTFFQPKDPKDDFFLGDYLVVAASEPFPPGTQRLRFTYEGKRVVRKVGPGNYFCQSFGWYPTYGTGRYSLTANSFADRYDFDITLRLDKKHKVVATGRKIEESKDKKHIVTRWKSEVPLTVAGFAFGDYKIYTEEVGDTRVEVYANRKPDDFLRTIEMIAAGPILRPSGSSQMSSMAMGSLSPSRLAKEMGVEVGNTIKVFETYFGPYPYDKLAVSNIPYSYGQGWPSLLYISTLSFLDSNQRHQLGIDDHVQLTDYFRAHEASHQWWGHVVSWKSYHDQWLSEGFASYSGVLYTLFRRNPDEHFNLLKQHREELLMGDRERTMYDRMGPLYAGRRLSSAKHPGGYSTVVYNKGGWVLHMLRMMFYDEQDKRGTDAAFIDMMKDFTQTYQNKAASTEDFKAIVEKHMTPMMDLERDGKMDWFFNAWVYGMGIPEYKLNYSINPGPAAGQFVLTGKLTQSNTCTPTRGSCEPGGSMPTAPKLRSRSPSPSSRPR
jgi:hypothetical protein